MSSRLRPVAWGTVLAFPRLPGALRAGPASGPSIYGTTTLTEVAKPAPSGATQAALDLNRLVGEMGAGRQHALETLYDATVSKVYGFALRLMRNPADAEEVVCDTYAQAWAGAGAFDATRANALGWLLMICRSRALDRLRQLRTDAGRVDIEAISELADEGPQPEELLSMLQEGTRVHEALAALAPERQQLVGMAFLKGFSHQEIADRTGLPLGTVKSHVRRALAEMRAALA
jgi:RNA polymerase sigma-70 factor (ECF subfamily)